VVRVNRTDIPGVRQGTQAAEAGPSQRPERSGRGGDRVNISSVTAQLQRLRESLCWDEEVRSDKVDRLREAVASGNYRVDSLEVAERFLREAMWR